MRGSICLMHRVTKIRRKRCSTRTHTVTTRAIHTGSPATLANAVHCSTTTNRARSATTTNARSVESIREHGTRFRHDRLLQICARSMPCVSRRLLVRMRLSPSRRERADAVTHVNGQLDADLHYEDGSHRSTPPSADGRQLEQWENRLKRHLAMHESEPVALEKRKQNGLLFRQQLRS